MHENERVIRAALGAVIDQGAVSGSAARADDPPRALAEILATDVVTHVPGRHPMARDYRGAAECIDGWLGELVRQTDGTLDAEVVTVLGGEGWAMGLFEFTATRKGRTHSWRSVNVFKMRDGQIVEEWMHPFDQYALDEFLSR